MNLEQLQQLGHITLINANINGHHALPFTLIGHLWGLNLNDPSEKCFQVMDRIGEKWELKAHMKWGPQGEARPQVDGPEWKQFVKLNHLKVGDRLIFYRHPDPNPNPNQNQVVFVLSIEREIRLMGGTFSGHINYTLNG